MAKLIKRSKIIEQEWNTEKAIWEPTRSELHHVYRACMETTLRQDPKGRIVVVHKSKEQIFISSLATVLSSYYLTKDAEVYSSLFNTGDNEALRVGSRYAIDNHKRPFFERDLQSSISTLAIATLPEQLARDMLQKVIDQANGENQNETVRLQQVKTILVFKERFPDMVDETHWRTCRAALGSGNDRICFVISQIALQNTHEKEQSPPEWILEGLSEFLTKMEDDPTKNETDPLFRKAVEGIDPKLLELPLKSALWDYVADITIDETPESCAGKKLPPIFQAIADGDVPNFEELVSKQRRLSSLKYDGFNLLHFATLQRQASIMRILLVDHDFDPIERDNRGWSPMELCLKQGSIDTMLELVFLYSVVHDKWVRRQDESEKNKKAEEPLRNLSLQLFRPRTLALLAGEGSFPAMEYVHQHYSNPRNLLSILSLDFYASNSPPQEDQHPLYVALRARRLRTFLRLLSWGSLSKRKYPADSIIGGKTILIHAIEELAPFFVAALLAYGADSNFSAGTGFTPLQIVCRDDGRGYIEAIKRRLKLHQSLNLTEKILNQSAVTPTDSDSMRKLIVELLLHSGAHINEGVDADQNADIENLPDSKDGFGIGPLGWCIMTQKTALAVFLIEKGADVRLKSALNSPLSQAVNEGQREVVECLLKNGISPNEAVDDMPVFVSAARAGKFEIFETFLNRGASLDVEIGQTSVLHVLLSERGGSTEDFLRLRNIITERLASMPGHKLRSLVNRRCGGEMAIHVAALTVRGRYNYELLRLIIQNTAKPDAVDGSGRTALQIAMLFGNVTFVSALAEFRNG
ncbi:ankyrin repeat-containing domain protein [Bisporella sp. PMI_857]|nr:ankyrin repeat-containing domain protein [Bisporella sp. PMI_857]